MSGLHLQNGTHTFFLIKYEDEFLLFQAVKVFLFPAGGGQLGALLPGTG